MTLGFATYAAMQYGMAQLINKLWWWFIAAFFIIAGSAALVFARPTAAFLLWLTVSPFGARFLGLQFEWSALPPLTFDLIVVYFLAALLVLQSMLNRSRLTRLVAPEVFMLAMPVYIALSYIIGNQASGFAEILRYFTRLFFPDALYVIVLYFTAKAAIQKKEHITWLMVSLVCVGLLMALIAFYEHFTGNRWYSIIVGFGIPLKWKDIGEGRASGMFDSVSAPATLVATTFFFAYYLALWTKKPHVRVFYYVTMVLMVFGAYFTYTRNVYGTLLLFALLIPFFAKEKRGKFAALSAVFFLGLMISVPRMLANERLSTRLTNRTNVYSRIASASTFVNMFKQNVWFGVGWGNADKRALEYVTSLKHVGGRRAGSLTRWVDNAHNTYVTVLSEQGIFGAFLYFGAMVSFIWFMWRLRNRIPEGGFFGRDMVSLFIVSSICYMASIMTWSNHIVRYPNYVFWIQFAAMVRLAQLIAAEQAGKQENETNGEVPLNGRPARLAAGPTR